MAKDEFKNPNQLKAALTNEVAMLDAFIKLAEKRRDGAKSQPEKAWFEVWVTRLDALKDQANKWVAEIDNNRLRRVREEMREEKRFLVALMRLMDSGIPPYLDEDDKVFEDYKEDFQATRRNLRNAMNGLR